MWVVNLEEELKACEPSAEAQKWPKNCIFRVPPRLKKLEGGFYKPRTVSLGPFHHNDPELLPMREHKLRAVWQLLRRTSKQLGELVMALEEVAEELEAAFAGLGDEWRGVNRGRFLETMVVDGCFLLEMMIAYDVALSGGDVEALGYAHGDPVYGKHGVQHTAPFVQRDMLVVENQLPLLVLQRIDAVANGLHQEESGINSEVLKDLEINLKVLNFLEVVTDVARNRVKGMGLGLHPLDIYRRSQFGVAEPPAAAVTAAVSTSEAMGSERAAAAARDCLNKCLLWLLKKLLPGRKKSGIVVHHSARRLYEMGIWFRRNTKAECLDDVHFRSHGEVCMPTLAVDDATEHRLHNMMAFEALCGGARNDVTAYVLFMNDIISTADDVDLLIGKGIVENNLAGGDGELVAMFNGLARDVHKNGRSRVCRDWDDIDAYCRRDEARVHLNRAWAHLKYKYFRSPWTSIALVAAIFLLCTDIVQTVCAVLSVKK